MKRKIWIIVLALISIASMASSTMAYFTGEDRAHNVITTGGVHVALVEQQRTGDTYTPFPKEGVTGVLPVHPSLRLCPWKTPALPPHGCASA